MPEGDTIHKLAAAMAPRLVGEPVEALWIRDRGAVAGARGAPVTDVVARGKHLLITLADRLVLRSHLGMKGSWHRYAPGEPWKKPEGTAGIRLETPGAVFVCFRPSAAELLEARALAVHPVLARLGPDLLAPEVDPDAVLTRARHPARATEAIAELLLDQEVAAGLGNVYKSELLFMERLHPRRPVGSLDDDALRRLYALGREQLLRNLGGWRRTTTYDARDPALRREKTGVPRLWVYGRAPGPCLVCGAPLDSARQGAMARWTYWCPACQVEIG